MKRLISILVMVWAIDARADAMLAQGSTTVFPTRVDVHVAIRAQVESTTIDLVFDPIAGGRYTLTVPPPSGASPIGVDLDRGDGLVALPAVAGGPSSAGGTSNSALDAWIGTAPLVADLRALTPGPLTVRVRFVRVLRRVGGQVAFEVGSWRCPARPADDPGAPVTIDLQLATARDLSQLDAPGAIIQAGIRGGNLHTVVATGDAIVNVTYAEVATGIGMQLVTHRTPTADPQGGDAGYFMLLVDADPAPSTRPRAISLVIDRSGSMGGDKIAQARDAARAMLDYLAPGDAFTIHAFDDDVSSFRWMPVPASDENIMAARTYIKSIEADASTDLDAGLQAGLAAPSVAGRFDSLVLLSDGLATSGETSDAAILANAWRASGANTRIFTFSVGNDADFALMEALARGSRGRHIDLNDAQSTRDLVVRARELFEDIRDVRLTDLAFGIDGVGISDTLPETPPDLFSGGQVMIVGRYTTPGIGAVRVTGFEGDLPFAQTTAIDAPALAEDDDIIKYVWATEKTRALMAQIANGGDAVALGAEIEAIGVAYRIQTPFSHYEGGGGSDGGGCSIANGATGMWLVVVAFVLARRPRRARQMHEL